MDFIDLVTKRKSVRKYLDKPVERELIEKCLEAARLAPSACNSQPWSFIVIENRELKDQIVEETMTGLYSLNKFASGAPVLVIAIREKSKYAARLAGTLRDVKYSLLDIGIACDHFTLQAAELGLGTCWIGWFNDRSMKKILKLPKSTQIDVVLTLGYPEDESLKIKSRKDLSSFTTFVK